MAVIQVSLTSESLHHLQMILDVAIDMSQPDGVAAAFKPILKALHHMVVLASTSPGSVPTETTVGGALQITLPKGLNATEQAMVAHLDHMEMMCVQSINAVNSTAPYKIVLEV